MPSDHTPPAPYSTAQFVADFEADGGAFALQNGGVYLDLREAGADAEAAMVRNNTAGNQTQSLVEYLERREAVAIANVSMPTDGCACPTALQHPDFALIRAGVALKLAFAAVESLSLDAPARDAAHDRASVLMRGLAAMEAHTATGAAVKAYAIGLCYQSDPVDLHFGEGAPTTDLRLANSMIADLRRMDWQAMAIAEGVEMDGLGHPHPNAAMAA